MIGGIIAAGHGSRFKEAGISAPKPLIRVNNKELLARTIEEFRDSGINKIRIIFRKKICSACSDFLLKNYPGIRFDILCKDTESSSESFLNLLKDLEEPILITTVDSIFEKGALKRFKEEAEKRKRFPLLGTTSFIDDEKPLYCEIDKNGKVLALGSNKTSTVTCGVYFMPSGVLNGLKKRQFPALRILLSHLLSIQPIYALDMGKVIDVDRPQDLVLADKILKEREKNLL